MSESDNPLCQGILSDAESKAQKKIESAKADAEVIINEAKDKANQAALAEKKSTDLHLESIRLREESAKRNIDRLTALKNMDSGYTEVMDEVNKCLSNLYQDKERCKHVLILWTAEAALGLGLKEAKAALSAPFSQDESILKEAEALLLSKGGSKVSLTLDDRAAVNFGVVLSSLDGKISYNNQIDTRMRRLQREIRTIVQETTCKAE